jgi:xanthine dehydrogenase accessory factor
MDIDRTSPAPWAPSSDDAIAQALRWRAEGRPTALATVLRTWGSSPRQPGSQLSVNDAREFVGSVSGGCVEGAVIHGALEVMATGEPRTMDFGVSDEEAWAVGLACGGKVSIYVEPVREAEEALLRGLLEARAARRGAVLATFVGSGEHALLRPLDQPESSPGRGDEAEGTIGRAVGGTALADHARAALLRDRSELLETPEGSVFLQVCNPPLRMIVVGAVHIAQTLAPMAALVGFDVTVVDPRRAFATDARFPGVRLVQGWPAEVLPDFALDHRTAVVTLSHDPKLDDPALEAALRSPAFYVGALGSRRTHAKRSARLAERGFGESELLRIHAPVGLDIGAVSPAEIALSALAQVVERLRSGALGGS